VPEPFEFATAQNASDNRCLSSSKGKKRAMNLVVGLLSVALAPALHANTALILDPNFYTDYSFYSYTDVYGVSNNNIPVGPYIANLNGGGYNNSAVYLFCLDYFSPTDVGTPYSGNVEPIVDFSDPEFTELMQASFLMNELQVLGGINAPLAERGAISMAVWEIMNPSSNTGETPFPADPAAKPWEALAASEVSSGMWTVADTAEYPVWVPDASNPNVQRFGLVIQGVSPVPEPGGLIMGASALLGIWVLRRGPGRRRSKRDVTPSTWEKAGPHARGTKERVPIASAD